MSNSITRGNIMDSSITKENIMHSSVMHFARSTQAVEAGFIAAGVMVSIIAVIQTIIIVMNWMAGD